MSVDGRRPSGRGPERGLLAVFAAVLAAASSGCVSHLQKVDLWPHAGVVAATYLSIGSVRVAEFEDQRHRLADTPSGEAGTAVEPGARQAPAPLVHLETTPPASFYLRKTVVDEAGRTGIFTVDETAALTLNVDLLSLQSAVEYTPLGGACEVSALCTLIFAYGLPVPLAYAGSAMVLTCALEFPAHRAEVRFRATLAREGERVFSTEILSRCSERFWLLGRFAQPLEMRDDAGLVLSRCMTRSVKELFEQLSRASLQPGGAAPRE